MEGLERALLLYPSVRPTFRAKEWKDEKKKRRDERTNGLSRPPSPMTLNHHYRPARLQWHPWEQWLLDLIVYSRWHSCSTTTIWKPHLRLQMVVVEQLRHLPHTRRLSYHCLGTVKKCFPLQWLFLCNLLNEAKSVAGKIWLLLHVQSTSCCCWHLMPKLLQTCPLRRATDGDIRNQWFPATDLASLK